MAKVELKQPIVEEISNSIKDAQSVVLVNYSGLTVEQDTIPVSYTHLAGFNLVRVHVHTEQEVFYDLCDELGIAVFQDSEYNWTHPSTDEWAQRFADVYRENVKLLKHHPSLICWIIMNEPGCIDPDGNVRRRFMEENPGPALYREVQKTVSYTHLDVYKRQV